MTQHDPTTELPGLRYEQDNEAKRSALAAQDAKPTGLELEKIQRSTNRNSLSFE